MTTLSWFRGFVLENPAKQGLHPVSNSWLHAAGEIDLPVEGREQFYRLQSTVVFGEPASVMHEFIGKVFEGVSQLLQPKAGIPRNSPAHGSAAACNELLVKRFYAESGMTVLQCPVVGFHEGECSSAEPRLSLSKGKFAFQIFFFLWTRLTNNRTRND